MESKNDQQRMIEGYINAYNAFDVQAMLQDLHEAVIFENSSNGQVDLRLEGIAAFKEQAEAAKSYFKERKQDPTTWRFQGNVVEVDIDYTATLAIDFPNGMKAGDTLDMKGQSVFEFKDGQIIKIQDKS